MTNGIWFGDLHSFEDLNLILSKVDLPPAAVKTTYVDNPGGDGSWDLTEANGRVNYKNREAKFTFSVLPQDDFEAKKTEISNILNGRRFQIVLDKDPEYYWDGRCSVNKYESNKKMRKIVVAATVAPYKLKKERTRVFVPFCGTNLFDCSDLQKLGGSSATLATIATGVRANWVQGKSAYVLIKWFPIEMLIGKTITFSCTITESGGAKGTAQIGYSAASGAPRQSKVKLEGSGAVSFTVEKTNSEHEYLAIWFYANNGGASVSEGAYVDYKNIQIELGETATPYMPYMAAAPLGKNLCNELLLKDEFTHNGITIKWLADEGCYLINGTYDVAGNYVSYETPYFAIPLEIGGSYTASVKYISGKRSADFGRVFFVHADSAIGANAGNWGQLTLNLQESNHTRTAIAEKNYFVKFRIYVYDKMTFENYKFRIQLEKGATATGYEPHKTDVDVVLTNGRKSVCPVIISTDKTNVKVDGLEFSLGEGSHKVLDFQLEEGENTATLSGSGAAAIVYQEGDL